MKVMDKLFKLFLAAAFGLFLVGCYNDMDNPGPAKIYTKADFADLEYWSIKTLKEKFIAENPGYPTNNGTAYNMVVRDDAYTCGKVISSDFTGNVYKTVYIYDEESERAIELKLNTGNYLFYPVGQMVYVKLKGLVIGNYRGMISIGTYSDDSEYANGNIVSRVMTREHIFSGEQLEMLPADTLVVNRSNYNTLTDDALGRLVRFEDITSTYGQTQWGYKNRFPNYFANKNSHDAVTNPEWPVWQSPTWALQREEKNPGEGFTTTFYFGSALFSYVGLGSTTVEGNYVVRSSGYSSFRDGKIPADGENVTITALYTKYTSSSGQNPAYQLVLNAATDVKKQ